MSGCALVTSSADIILNAPKSHVNVNDISFLFSGVPVPALPRFFLASSDPNFLFSAVRKFVQLYPSEPARAVDIPHLPD